MHRRHEYHVNHGEAESLHTYRVLSASKPPEKVSRIFLMHHGLNEIHGMGLYYQLASHLIRADKNTVCLLRPFPGHLTRSKFAGFAETPLDHYLWDGSHLFRQFLRYMIETQWLLSVIARRSTYRCASGMSLLAEHRDPDRSRLEDDVLARAMRSAWLKLYYPSKEATRDLHDAQSDATAMGSPLKKDVFYDAIVSLRGVLRTENQPRLSGELDPKADSEPAVHTVGYSLGGFTAQSVFMSWPFLVASCSTLLSGGALRELAPTAFAHREEWQTVLRSLRYELDEAMISGRYGVEISEKGGAANKAKNAEALKQAKAKDEDSAKSAKSAAGAALLAGIPADLFLYLKKTFYEVFQQEYRGSFQSRLVAFRRRMLFVVGGNDPIVRPQSVLDSGPPDGINLLTVGGLGHFLGQKPKDDEERAQRLFWLPEIGRLVDRLAADAARRQEAERPGIWLDAKMRLPENPPSKAAAKREGRLSVAERMAVERDGALPGGLFQRCLDDLLARATRKDDGLLFILRNEAPTLLLDDDAIQEHGVALHHDDLSIADYIQGVRRRHMILKENGERISVILPWNVEGIMRDIDSRPGHPSQSEGVGGQMPRRTDVSVTLKKLIAECASLTKDSTPDAVRILDGRRGVDAGGLPKLDIRRLTAAARAEMGGGHLPVVKTSLPDCWVWMAADCFRIADGQPLDTDVGRRRLCKVMTDDYLSGDLLENLLHKDRLRMVTVSRARYNPRFRGRIVTDPKMARDLLFHVTLCIAASVPFRESELYAGSDEDGVSKAAA